MQTFFCSRYGRKEREFYQLHTLPERQLCLQWYKKLKSLDNLGNAKDVVLLRLLNSFALFILFFFFICVQFRGAATLFAGAVSMTIPLSLLFLPSSSSWARPGRASSVIMVRWSPLWAAWTRPSPLMTMSFVLTTIWTTSSPLPMSSVIVWMVQQARRWIRWTFLCWWMLLLLLIALILPRLMAMLLSITEPFPLCLFWSVLVLNTSLPAMSCSQGGSVRTLGRFSSAPSRRRRGIIKATHSFHSSWLSLSFLPPCLLFLSVRLSSCLIFFSAVCPSFWLKTYQSTFSTINTIESWWSTIPLNNNI